jgi:sugar phosphate isomerase/epimerase
MDVALAPLTVGRPAPDVVVDAAAAAGFRRVGMTLWRPDAEQSSLCTDPAARRRLLARLDGAGVSVLDAGVVSLRSELDRAGVARFVEAAADLGADRIIALHRDGPVDRAAAHLSEVCSLAAAAGLRVAVEFMPYTACRTVQEAITLVARAGAVNAGLVIDVLHLFRSGGSVPDLAGLHPSQVLLVQLCDARLTAPPPERLRAEALTDRRYPGQGQLPLDEVLAALPAGVPMTIESPVAADAALAPADRARAAWAAARELLAGSA